MEPGISTVGKGKKKKTYVTKRSSLNFDFEGQCQERVNGVQRTKEKKLTMAGVRMGKPVMIDIHVQGVYFWRLIGNGR